jgi:hypothetical protein
VQENNRAKSVSNARLYPVLPSKLTAFERGRVLLQRLSCDRSLALQALRRLASGETSAMRTVPILLLTWGTAVAGVSSAVWLSSMSQPTLLCAADMQMPGGDLGLEELVLPSEAPAAGPGGDPGSGSPSRRPPSSSS